MPIRNKIQNVPVCLERNMSVSFWWFFDSLPQKAVVESKIYDRYHDISLLLEIDLSKQTIIESEIEERRTPFSSCPGAITNYDFLNGKKFNRPALEIMLREHIPLSKNGCIRIDQLLFYAVDNFISALGYELKSRQLPKEWNEEYHSQESKPFAERSAAVHQWWIKDRVMKNSCFTMSADFENLEAREKLNTSLSITPLLLGLRKGK
ncbi:DUF2889 domain-containing protein [Leptospira ognonensis]|uniref:DUF2889 domain-containing protein n=2 Tax=Leptospira ognonensis TaxID=2484945 RepID=A0A4R9K0I4_9LEPT|nr:DUF2889 domain-containing protein [Leptospira ognonensis]